MVLADKIQCFRLTQERDIENFLSTVLIMHPSQKALQACQVRHMAQMSCVAVVELLRWQYPNKETTFKATLCTCTVM